KQVIEQLAHGFRRRRDVQGVTRRVLAAADPVLILPDPTCPVPVAGILVIAHEKAVNLQNVGELHLSPHADSPMQLMDRLSRRHHAERGGMGATAGDSSGEVVHPDIDVLNARGSDRLGADHESCERTGPRSCGSVSSRHRLQSLLPGNHVGRCWSEVELGDRRRHTDYDAVEHPALPRPAALLLPPRSLDDVVRGKLRAAGASAHGEPSSSGRSPSLFRVTASTWITGGDVPGCSRRSVSCGPVTRLRAHLGDRWVSGPPTSRSTPASCATASAPTTSSCPSGTCCTGTAGSACARAARCSSSRARRRARKSPCPDGERLLTTSPPTSTPVRTSSRCSSIVSSTGSRAAVSTITKEQTWPSVRTSRSPARRSRRRSRIERISSSRSS